MAAPYTTTADLANLIADAYDRKVAFALKSATLFRQVADKRPVNASMPSDTITFNLHNFLEAATTPLDEVTDPTGAVIPETTKVTLTAKEYGNWTTVTNALKQFTFSNSLESDVVTVITQNILDSVDKLVSNVLDSGDNNIVESSTGAISVVANADLATATITENLTANALRYAVAQLRSKSVATFDGSNYVIFVHPKVASDFRASQAGANWRTAQEYQNITNLINGEIGTWEGVRFVETPRVPNPELKKTTDPVTYYTEYTAFIVGKEAIAEYVTEEFHVVANGTIVDPLTRKMPIGWKGTGVWGVYRPDALWTIKTQSSIA